MKTKNLTFIYTLVALLILPGCATQLPLDGTKINQRLPLHMACYRHKNRVITLTCKPLMLSEIQLAPNEAVMSINSGDTARWSFQIIVSNTDTHPLTHILIKPKENNIKTNLIIATNLGLHEINLISHDGKSMHASIKFREATVQYEHQCKKIDTRYKIKMSCLQKVPSWLPRSIYNDGQSTFIYMPTLKKDAAPSFYVLNEDNTPTIVNYHVNQNIYRVDQLFSKGILIKGVGSKQQKITINYLGDLSQTYE